MAPKMATAVDLSRADHPLAHAVSVELRVKIKEAQNSEGCDRVDLGPIALGAFSTWNSLYKIPALRIRVGFPKTSSFLDSMQDQVVQIIGMCCLSDYPRLNARLSVDERAQATEARSEIMEELATLPVWVETRLELLSVELRQVVCRILNATIETVFELQAVLSDPVLAQLTNKCAETCLRCRFQRAPNSGVIASATPPSPRTTTPWHGSLSQAYGFGPPRDPNIEMSDLARHPPATTPPSTHLTGGRLGIYATTASARAHDDDVDSGSWSMGD